MAGLLFGRGLWEPGLLDGFGLKRQVDQRMVGFRARDGTDAKRFGVASGQDDPLSTSRTHERTGAINLHRRHQLRPSATERRLNVPGQDDSSPAKTTTSKPLSLSALTIDAVSSKATA